MSRPKPYRAESEKISLNFDELVIACRNVGINLECGGCASLFFTGHGGDPHDENCKVVNRDTAVEIWSLFNQLESIIESLVVNDYRTINATWRLAEARMWLEKLEIDEFDTKKWPV